MTIISNIFIKTAWPVKAKFNVEHPREDGAKQLKRSGHMSKMADMSIYGINLQTPRSRIQSPMI